LSEFDQNVKLLEATMKSQLFFAVLAGASMAQQPILGQTASTGAALQPAVILDVRIENRVVYGLDTSDVSKYATNPNPTAPVGIFTSGTTIRTFGSSYSIADIVSINRRPVKGTWTIRGTGLNMSPSPAPGGAIADIARASQIDEVFEILQPDGTAIGTLFCLGIGGGTPPGAVPPGSPLIATNTNAAIVGGTGAFLGARGQQELVQLIQAEHQASVTEDPANRRITGAGAGIRRVVLHIIPMFRPEIATASAGPAIVHASDFSLVTAAKPAHAGELLTLFATGLGPTRPGVDPGQPFPSSPLQTVNSPVEVSVNGNSGDVLYAGGYPGAVDGYQVNFRVPQGATPGTGSLQLTVAFIPSAPVNIAVQ